MQIPPFHTRAPQSGKLLCAFLILSSVCVADRAVAGQITGRFLFNGSPVPGTEIAFRTPASIFQTWFGTAQPSSNGIFNTSADLITGTYESFTYRSSFVNPTYLAPHRTSLEVNSGQVLDIGDVALIQADRAITGTVASSSSNNPDFITVVSTATIDGVEYVVRTTPDDTRSFRLPAANGTWAIVASYFSTILDETVVTVSGADVSNVQLGQPVPEGKIIGRLIQSNGLPVPFAPFSIRSLDPGSLSFTSSTAIQNGTFSLFLPPGRYELGTLIASSGTLPTSLAQYVPEFTVVDGETRDLGDLLVLTSLFFVTGNVFDANENPTFADLTAVTDIEGVPFHVWSWSSGDGSFLLRLADANWTVTAEDFYGSSSQVMVNVAGEDVSGVAITFSDDPAAALTYEEWVAIHGLTGDDALRDADPDGDGYKNVREFAFGTDPTRATASLTATSRNQSTLTISWLQLEGAEESYAVENSVNLQTWEAAEVNVEPGTVEPAPPAGYVRRQFAVPVNGRNFFRLSAIIEPDTEPVDSFTITVAGAPVTVERWGTGPKAIVFFGYVPFEMEENLKREYGAEFAALVGEEYSMFLWTYPGNAAPYSQVQNSLNTFFQSPFTALNNRLVLSGQASSVVAQIRDATGLEDVCLVGNSFGAGVIFWDLATLANDPRLRFVLISPTELFMPYTPPVANPLPRTVLVSDAQADFPLLYTQEAADYVGDRTNGPLPPGYVPGFFDPHFIIGEFPTTLEYVFDLIDQVYQP